MKMTLELPDLDDIMNAGDVGLSEATSFWSHFANLPPSQRGEWQLRLATWVKARRATANEVAEMALNYVPGGRH